MGKRLTASILDLFELLDKRCRLRGSTQHLRAVYSRESEIPRSPSDVDLSAARLGRAAPENSQTGLFLAGSIALKAGWCFRSCHAARDSADRRNQPAHPEQ